MVDKIEAGIIGLSEGNGHPYSFSCIINGYNETALRDSGWKNIYEYIRKRDKSEFGFQDAQIKYVWTQNPIESEKIARAANIPHVVDDYYKMIGNINALIIARDDFETHFPIAKPFLESGSYVFVDKPLSLKMQELEFFKPYLDQGRLMSCSGLRYATELNPLREEINSIGDIKLIRGAVLNNFHKYGVHILDAIFNCIPFHATKTLAIDATHESAIIFNEDGSIIQIDALGEVVKTFQIDFFGSKGRFHAELNDNFGAFRQTLFYFFKMVKEEKPVIDPDLTISIMKIIIAHDISLKEKRIVELNEIDV